MLFSMEGAYFDLFDIQCEEQVDINFYPCSKLCSACKSSLSCYISMEFLSPGGGTEFFNCTRYFLALCF